MACSTTVQLSKAPTNCLMVETPGHVVHGTGLQGVFGMERVDPSSSGYNP